MITALSVSIPEHRKGIMGLADRLKKDKLEVEICKARGVQLKHITYTSFSGEIRLDKASRAIGAQRGQLLCSEKLVFPHKSGYKRFFSTSFSARLCTNMALSVLQECKCSASLRVGIYDLKATDCDFLINVLEYCSDVVAVTQNERPYFYVADRALDEIGATALITKNTSELSECDLIIAPSVIDVSLPLKASAIVLTTKRPKCKVGGMVYYRYNFSMPNGFAGIKPEELDEEYFCSALYTLGAQYELGSIVPLSCRNENMSQTVKSLCAAIESQKMQ